MKICKKCSNSFSTMRCGECYKIWVANNKDRVKALGAAWAANNKEKRAASSKEWQRKNFEKMRAKSLAYYYANKEKSAERVAARRERNPEANRASTAAWKLANPNAASIYRQNRRARIAAAGGVLSTGLADKLLSLQKGKCACCGAQLGGKFHLDHIMPIALGGKNEDSNIQLLSPKCNSQKNMKHPVDFMQSRGFLI